MGFVIGLLTFVLVLDCVFLILLVLVQLPKKEAGAGLAFGGAASDALFGAGSGTVLTRITKYVATVFFVLALLLGIIQKSTSTTGFQRQLAGPERPRQAALPPMTPSTTTSNTAVPALASSNAMLTTTAPESTNLPKATPATSNLPPTAASTNTSTTPK